MVAKADLDGKGQPSTVRLAGERVGALRGQAARPTVASGPTSAGSTSCRRQATVVHLHGAGAPDLVLLSAKPHPRGGWQPHLFGSGGETGLTEVTSEGRPVVPFVATDGGAPPMTATCTKEGGVAVMTATAPEPPGVVLAWDVHRTTYTRRTAGRRPPARVEKAAADPLLRKERPELFDGTLFANCD